MVVFVINNVFLYSNMQVADNYIHLLIGDNSLIMYVIFVCTVQLMDSTNCMYKLFIPMKHLLIEQWKYGGSRDSESFVCFWFTITTVKKTA